MRRHGFTAARPARGRRSLDGVASRGSRCTCRSPGLAPDRGEPADDRRRRRRPAHPPGLRLAPVRHRARRAARSPYPDYTFRPRIGTELWLGDRGALRGPRHGARRAPGRARRRLRLPQPHGTRGRHHPGGLRRHGARHRPRGAHRRRTLRARAARLARGGLDAAGLVRSPYTVDGKQRLFAEPPHMQASMLFLPTASKVPAIGDEVDVRVRFTATTFDEHGHQRLRRRASTPGRGRPRPGSGRPGRRRRRR